jgi:hypothetical protein
VDLDFWRALWISHQGGGNWLSDSMQKARIGDSVCHLVRLFHTNWNVSEIYTQAVVHESCNISYHICLQSDLSQSDSGCSLDHRFQAPELFGLPSENTVHKIRMLVEQSHNTRYVEQFDVCCYRLTKHLSQASIALRC